MLWTWLCIPMCISLILIVSLLDNSDGPPPPPCFSEEETEAWARTLLKVRKQMERFWKTMWPPDTNSFKKHIILLLWEMGNQRTIGLFYFLYKRKCVLFSMLRVFTQNYIIVSFWIQQDKNWFPLFLFLIRLPLSNLKFRLVATGSKW